MLTPEEEAHKAKLLKEVEDLEKRARTRFLSDAFEARKQHSFAKVVDPEALARLQRFQSVFGRYFPVLLESETATIGFHQQIMDGIFGNPIQTIKKSTFEDDLKRFKGAIKVLADWPIWGTMVHFGGGPMALRLRDDQQKTDVENAAVEIFDCLLTIEDIAHHYKKLPQVLNQLESWARKMTVILPDRRNINWEAVNSVDRLRGYWEYLTDSLPPRRALNPASPFADYLRDAFQFFEISGDPIAAFKRWVVISDSFENVRVRKSK